MVHLTEADNKDKPLINTENVVCSIENISRTGVWLASATTRHNSSGRHKKVADCAQTVLEIRSKVRANLTAPPEDNAFSRYWYWLGLVDGISPVIASSRELEFLNTSVANGGVGARILDVLKDSKNGMNNTELARHCDCAAETVARVLSGLRKDGTIRSHRRGRSMVNFLTDRKSSAGNNPNKVIILNDLRRGPPAWITTIFSNFVRDSDSIDLQSFEELAEAESEGTVLSEVQKFKGSYLKQSGRYLGNYAEQPFAIPQLLQQTSLKQPKYINSTNNVDSQRHS